MTFATFMTGLVFGLLGFAGNWFNYELFQDVHFLFGSVFVMFCLLRFGAVSGIMAGIIASLATFLLWHHPWNILIFSLEVVFVAYLHRRRQADLLSAEILFWLLIAPALGWLFYYLIMDLPGDVARFLIIKQAVNSIVNLLFALCGYIVISLVPKWGAGLPSYRLFIPTIMLVVTLFPALIYSVVGIRGFQFRCHDEAIERTRSIAKLSRATVDYWLSKELQTIKGLAAAVNPELMPEVEMQRLAEEYLWNDALLKQIGVMTRDAISTAYAPAFDSLGKSTRGLDFSNGPDRVIIQNLSMPYVGDIQRGQIEPESMELPLLAPIFSGSKNIGFCRGVVDLGALQALLDGLVGPKGGNLILIDRNGVVVASTDPSSKVMAPWRQAKGDVRSQDSEVFLWQPSQAPGRSPFFRWHHSFYYSEVRLSPEIGWTLRMKAPLLPAVTQISDYATIVFVLMAVLIVVMYGVSFLISRYHIESLVTLQKLTAQVARDPKIVVSSWPSSPIQEVDALTRNLRQMADGLHARIHGMEHLNRHLDELVQLRTAELDIVNHRLMASQRIAHLGSWEFALQSDKLVWSEEIYRIFEVDPERFEVTFNSFLVLVHPEDRANVEQVFAASLATGTFYEFRHRILMSDGRIKYVYEQGETVYDQEGKPLLTRGTVQDISELVRTDEERKLVEFRFQTIFNQSPDGMLIFDPLTLGRAIEYNETACLQLGYSREEFACLDVSDYEALESPAETAAHIRHVIETGSDEFETKHRRKDGEIRHVQVTVKAFHEYGRNLILGIHRDITARKRAEEELQESRELFALLMHYSPVYTFVKEVANGVSRHLALSDNYELMLGRPVGAMIGKSMAELFPADAALKITADDIAVIEEGEIVELEETFDDRVYTTIKFPIYRSGRSPLLAGFSIDVTDRKKMDSVLRESEERYRNLVEYSSVWIWETDATLLHTYSNAQIVEILGYSLDDFLEMSIFELVHPDDHQKLREVILRALTEKESWRHRVFRWRHQGGSWRVLESSGTPFFDAEGKVCGLRGVDIDITDRWQAQESLSELNRTLDSWVKEETNARLKNERMLIQQSKMAAMGEMIGAIAHQWRQPLNAVAGIVQDIKGAFIVDNLDREYLQESVEDVMHQLRFMSKTVDDFRDFFRPDKLREDFDVKMAMVEVLSMFT
ncbi:MAG: PAS domain S-box protein, partial [Desulfobulbaceae bacterium]|nr:PAS domain S-box protein [Desulfobulbaceae bacterium]